jgi:tetratricopeptide (TPR) repeat protein
MKTDAAHRLDLPHVLIAAGVWLTAFIVYTLTKAPTLSFWDCGEFIAASAILGVPHPPGSPLYILFGRIFALLPLAADIGVRVNMLSVVSSSFAALFGYLIAARILRMWFGADRSPFTRGLIYAGSAAGALFAAFGFTNWNNSVEAEVYGMTMMLMTAIIWLTLVYLEKKGSPAGDRIMLLIVYLGFLGIGVHMSTFLAIPVAALFFIFKNQGKAKVWYAAAIFIALELYLIFAMSSRPGEIPYYIPVTIVFLFYLFYVFSFERIPGRYILVGAGFLLAIAPLYNAVLASLGGNGKDASAADGTARLLNVIGKTAFVALIVFALVMLFQYLTRKKSSEQKGVPLLVCSSFILAAALLFVLLYLPKGYIPFLVVSGIVTIVLVALLRRDLHWPILIAVIGVSLVMLGVKQFFFGMIVSALAILAAGLIFRMPRWKTALMIPLCAVLGYSIHLFIPIRAAQQPAINENNPSSLSATINFLERKQYGSQSMVERMFKRRAEWVNQFGDYRRMGFWRFFQNQYGFTGPKFVLPFLLGLFGVWEVIRKRYEVGLPFLILLLITSVGLILYMNFADGTRQNPITGADYLEVRDRDYFFTPAFVFFGLAAGIGITMTVYYIRQATAQLSAVSRKIIVAASLLLFLLPSYALARNYYYCDRSRNYMPYDYAWNLLQSADPNAVLFTYGDNDTFPLWCLQEAYGVRKDVKVVNLSLANTRWYIKQLKNNMNLELGWSDKEIDRLRPYRTRDGKIFQLRDQVIDAIITYNRGVLPINFSVTVAAGARRFRGEQIDTLLEMSGMVWRLDTVAGPPLRVDLESSIDFFTNLDKFRARGADDPTIYKDETTYRLTSNWANGFLVVADTLRKAGDLATAEKLAKLAVQKIPHAADAVEFLAKLYADQSRAEELRALIDEAQSGDRRLLNFLLGQVERKRGRTEEAERILKSVLNMDPTYQSAFRELVRIYYEARQLDRLQMLMEQWLQFNPRDNEVKRLLRELKRSTAGPDSISQSDS